MDLLRPVSLFKVSSNNRRIYRQEDSNPTQRRQTIEVLQVCLVARFHSGQIPCPTLVAVELEWAWAQAQKPWLRVGPAVHKRTTRYYPGLISDYSAELFPYYPAGLFKRWKIKVESFARCRRNTLSWQTHKNMWERYWTSDQVYSGYWVNLVS